MRGMRVVTVLVLAATLPASARGNPIDDSLYASIGQVEGTQQVALSASKAQESFVGTIYRGTHVVDREGGWQLDLEHSETAEVLSVTLQENRVEPDSFSDDVSYYYLEVVDPCAEPGDRYYFFVRASGTGFFFNTQDSPDVRPVPYTVAANDTSCLPPGWDDVEEEASGCSIGPRRLSPLAAAAGTLLLIAVGVALGVVRRALG